MDAAINNNFDNDLIQGNHYDTNRRSKIEKSAGKVKKSDLREDLDIESSNFNSSDIFDDINDLEQQATELFPDKKIKSEILPETENKERKKSSIMPPLVFIGSGIALVLAITLLSKMLKNK